MVLCWIRYRSGGGKDFLDGRGSVWFIWCCCCCHFKLVMEGSIGWQGSICSRGEAVFITLTQTFDWRLCFLAWHPMPEVTVLAYWLFMLTKRKTADFFGVFCGVCLWFDGCRPTAPGTNAAVNSHHDLHVLSEYLHLSLLWAAFVSLPQHLCQPIRSFWMWWRPPTLGMNASVNPIVIFMCYLNVFTASLSGQSSCLCLNISASLSDLSGCGEDNQPMEQMLQRTPSWSSCAIWISSLVSLSEHLCQPIWSLSDVVKTTNSWNNASVTPTMIFRCYLNVFSSLSFEQHSYLYLNISVSPSDLFGCSEDSLPDRFSGRDGQ